MIVVISRRLKTARSGQASLKVQPSCQLRMSLDHLQAHSDLLFELGRIKRIASMPQRAGIVAATIQNIPPQPKLARFTRLFRSSSGPVESGFAEIQRAYVSRSASEVAVVKGLFDRICRCF